MSFISLSSEPCLRGNFHEGNALKPKTFGGKK